MLSSLLEVALVAGFFFMLVDIFVIGITWKKTFRHVKEVSRAGIRNSIGVTLLRDGNVTLLLCLFPV